MTDFPTKGVWRSRVYGSEYMGYGERPRIESGPARRVLYSVLVSERERRSLFKFKFKFKLFM